MANHRVFNFHAVTFQPSTAMRLRSGGHHLQGSGSSDDDDDDDNDDDIVFKDSLIDENFNQEYGQHAISKFDFSRRFSIKGWTT